MSDLLSKTREICRLFEIKPSRSKGQNFLINERIYDDIIRAADLQADDIVLEVGPGLGFLTAKLAHRAKRVIAVELDDRLADYLQTGIDSQDINNVTVVNEDILRFNPAAYSDDFGATGAFSGTNGLYKIVANLPYNISSIFLRRFLGRKDFQPKELILMLQQEVAERIVASPPDMSLLAVSVQYYGEPEIIRTVKAGNFWPEPQVDSAIVRIKVKMKPDIDNGSDLIARDKRFFQLLRIGFSSKRKMLKNNLAAGLKLEPSALSRELNGQGLDPQARAEALSLQDWQKLFAALEPFML